MTEGAPRTGNPPMDGAGVEQPGLMHVVGNAIRQPEALQKAANVVANIGGHAITGWDKAQEPGKAATVAGMAGFVEGAAGELAPYTNGEAPDGSVRSWAQDRLKKPIDTPEDAGKVRGWLYRRFDSLRGLATTENLQRAVSCAALIKSGVEFTENLDRTRTV